MFCNVPDIVSNLMLTYSVTGKASSLKDVNSSMDLPVLKDTQLHTDPGPAEFGVCCCPELEHNTHRALSVNNDSRSL